MRSAAIGRLKGIGLRALLVLSVGLITSVAQAADGLDLERFRGKVVVVDFWASWCAPCRQSFPWLNEMQAKYGSAGLVVIAVNVDRERAEAERFLREVPGRVRDSVRPTRTTRHPL